MPTWIWVTLVVIVLDLLIVAFFMGANGTSVSDLVMRARSLSWKDMP